MPEQPQRKAKADDLNEAAMAFNALRLINAAMGIANTGREAESEDNPDARACVWGTAHLLAEASRHVAELEQFIRQLPKPEVPR